MTDDVLTRLREIRNREGFVMKPSPYLKPHFEDDSGNLVPIELRNYQKQGVMNLLMMERFILGDSTGLGKTIQILSTIGYIFLKEPNYLPIILTTKSALFQWAAECRKFMQGMVPIVINGNPHERFLQYDEVFRPNDEKRIVLMTYDTFLRDADGSIIRDKSNKADPKLKKKLKELNAIQKTIKDRYDSLSGSLRDLLSDNPLYTDYAFDYVFDRTGYSKPSPWDPSWDGPLNDLRDCKRQYDKVRIDHATLDKIVNPQMTTVGIVDRVRQLESNRFMLVLDEAHKVKNHKSKIHESIEKLSKLCDRNVAVTATPVKNRLMEFFGIFHIINPKLFPKISQFQNDFCVTKLQRISGGRHVPIIVGYKNLDNFVSKIEPYYLARQKSEVAKELPELISIEIQCELSDEQDNLYEMAEADVGDESEEGETNAKALSSLIRCQQAVNAPSLLMDEEGKPFTGTSSKINELIELIENNQDQKMIVFSRFEKMISLIEEALKKSDIKCCRITGKETSSKVRQEAKEKFQDLNSGINIILITTAGSESLNLQAAEHFVFVDLPWSTGDYIQLIGRMIRIGSTHKTVVAHHMLGVRQNGDDTIDHHVLKALRLKKKLIDKVAGDSLKDGLKFKIDDSVQDVLSAIRQKNRQNRKSTTKPKLKDEASIITIDSFDIL